VLKFEACGAGALRFRDVLLWFILGLPINASCLAHDSCIFPGGLLVGIVGLERIFGSRKHDSRSYSHVVRSNVLPPRALNPCRKCGLIGSTVEGHVAGWGMAISPKWIAPVGATGARARRGH